MKNYKKTEEFTPIAMKCNQEQFEDIKPILENFDCVIEHIVDNWNEFETLVNNNFKKEKHITNHCISSFSERLCYNEWNAETFLKACGIVEVDTNIDLSKLTPELINELSKDQNVKQILIDNGVVKNELEVGKWYKINDSKFLKYLKEHNSFNNNNGYGFDMGGIWTDNNFGVYNVVLATPQEVETALINEAIKRGYKVGDKIKPIENYFYGSSKMIIDNLDFKFAYLDNELYIIDDDRCCVSFFVKGQWAEIVKEETYVKIPLSEIKATPNDEKLGALVRSISENY